MISTSIEKAVLLDKAYTYKEISDKLEYNWKEMTDTERLLELRKYLDERFRHYFSEASWT